MAISATPQHPCRYSSGINVKLLGHFPCLHKISRKLDCNLWPLTLRMPQWCVPSFFGSHGCPSSTPTLELNMAHLFFLSFLCTSGLKLVCRLRNFEKQVRADKNCTNASPAYLKIAETPDVVQTCTGRKPWKGNVLFIIGYCLSFTVKIRFCILLLMNSRDSFTNSLVFFKSLDCEYILINVFSPRTSNLISYVMIVCVLAIDRKSHTSPQLHLCF